MPNDITTLGRSTQQSGGSAAAKYKPDSNRPGRANSETSNNSSADKVSLTSTAAKLKALEEQLSSQPDVDMRKVSEIQAAIADGRYNVDPENIADKMMSFEENF